MMRLLAGILLAMPDPFLLVPAIVIGIVASRLSTVLIAAIIGAFIEAAVPVVLEPADLGPVPMALPYKIGIAFVVDCLLVFALASGRRERRRLQSKTDRSAT
jgi:hypothetical protein